MHVKPSNCRLGAPSGKQRSGSRMMVGRAGDGPSCVPEEGGGQPVELEPKTSIRVCFVHSNELNLQERLKCR